MVPAAVRAFRNLKPADAVDGRPQQGAIFNSFNVRTQLLTFHKGENDSSPRRSYYPRRCTKTALIAIGRL
jgi:hypothetical protein